ncbi:hypothetical protein [Cryobacterium mannosilyticum]|uniref:Uncharacterized protein n=1 Tax=Cryobacterium mannosilyticum TaxID=1259190 RepID=A0A4R8WHA4_9MICO|nr:hypothetical protein [Cryobacterium mannosilyticum]TFC06749.1 hypothetical protein E3O32_03290 [Cryobacterium mannosilyticum]
MHDSTDTLANAMTDQLEAEIAEARRLAPHNRFMRAHPVIGPMIIDAVTHLDGGRVANGDNPVPIIRARDALSAHTSELTRTGTVPIASRACVRYCDVCNNAQAILVPFWVAFGQYIVQIELCGECADSHICDYGASPQAASE